MMKEVFGPREQHGGEEQDDIAQNMALKENIFMMILSIENRIPLFLIGKPGSSKSLAKSMVTNALRGQKSNSGLFKHMKRVRMLKVFEAFVACSFQ